MTTLELTGSSLSPEALWKFSQLALNPAARPKIVISPKAREQISAAERLVADIVKKNKPVYGINTGFGKFAEVAISQENLTSLQHNLILSHCAGTGPLLPRDLVLAQWVLRLNTLCRGNSGIRLSTVDYILKLIEANVFAEVPSRGSVGASGDLAPAAHATLVILGEGFCQYPTKDGFIRMRSAEALSKIGLAPLTLAPKEGLSLINGTQLTTALANKLFVEGKNLVAAANFIAALSLEALKGSRAIVDPRILKVRNQPGALECGAQIAQWLGAQSEVSLSHADCGKVQDPYSLRCSPQVHGAIFDEFSKAAELLNRELNATTDNPLLFVEDSASLSGGNFHAIYTARVCDALASALTTLSNISERRMALAMSPESNGGLPAFLVRDGGLNSGFMMAQVTAAALVSESKSLCFPASVDSIPTSDDREDHVSMGPGAGHKALQIAFNTNRVLALELMAAAQALDFLRPLKSSPKIEKAHSLFRQHVSFLENDRVLSTDIESAANFIARSLFNKDLS